MTSPLGVNLTNKKWKQEVSFKKISADSTRSFFRDLYSCAQVSGMKIPLTETFSFSSIVLSHPFTKYEQKKEKQE